MNFKNIIIISISAFVMLIYSNNKSNAAEMFTSNVRIDNVWNAKDSYSLGSNNFDKLLIASKDLHTDLTRVSDYLQTMESIGVGFSACSLSACDDGFGVAAQPLTPFFTADPNFKGAFSHTYPFRRNLTAPGLQPVTWIVITGVFAVIGLGFRQFGKVSAEALVSPRREQRRSEAPVFRKGYPMHYSADGDRAASPMGFRQYANGGGSAVDVVYSQEWAEPGPLAQPILAQDRPVETDLMAQYNVFTFVHGTVDSCQTFDALNDPAALSFVQNRKADRNFELWRGRTLVARHAPLN